MRSIIIAIALGLVWLTSFPALWTSDAVAQSDECTGENCPPPDQGRGGHDCESKEQTVS